MTKKPTSTSLAFKEIKKRITECDLDPLQKGYLMMRINKVIKNKDSHFKSGNASEGFAFLFDWGKNSNSGINDTVSFWSMTGLYLMQGGDFYKKEVVRFIAEAGF